MQISIIGQWAYDSVRDWVAQPRKKAYFTYFKNNINFKVIL